MVMVQQLVVIEAPCAESRADEGCTGIPTTIYRGCRTDDGLLQGSVVGVMIQLMVVIVCRCSCGLLRYAYSHGEYSSNLNSHCTITSPKLTNWLYTLFTLVAVGKHTRMHCTNVMEHKWEF